MARSKGSANLAASLEVLAGAPLDAREVVQAKADLTAQDSFPYKYIGLEVYVVAENKKYRLIGNDPTNIENWEEVGTGGGTSDYSDLTNKPQIEGVTLSGNKTASDLGLAKITDLADFITKTVDDLVNYYTKSQTYSKTEVDAIATAIKNSRFEVVATLPTTDIKTNIIYLVPKAESESGDIKDEYINLDGTTAGWERIGSTDIDLSGYVTTTALNTALANYTTSTDLTVLLAGKQDKVQYSTLPTASAELEGKIFEYTGVTGGGFTHGYFYECVSDGENPATYSWVQTNVQPSGGGGGSTDYEDLDNKPSVEGVTLSGNKTASDLGLDKVRELTQAQYAALSEQEKMNGTSYFITDGEGGGAYSIQKATLQAGATTVTFTVPTTGDYILDVYASDGRNYTDVDMSVSGSVTLIFNAPSSDITVYLELKGV